MGVQDPAVKYLPRPPIVHQMKETTGKETTTKCGLVGTKKTPVLTTVWTSEVTCAECSP